MASGGFRKADSNWCKNQEPSMLSGLPQGGFELVQPTVSGRISKKTET